ncbi:hypothetical protein JW979_02530 [bacterium]|nr:hypothetical protein [candidate division CSSED10-310 bacterium]
MAVCPNCMNPFPKGTSPDSCPRCGYVIVQKSAESVDDNSGFTHKPFDDSSNNSPQNKKSAPKKKKKFSFSKKKVDPSRIRPPKIKKIRDPTLIVKKAKARFFMIIMGFVITIMVFVVIFKKLTKPFTSSKPKQSVESSASAQKTSDPGDNAVTIRNNEPDKSSHESQTDSSSREDSNNASKASNSSSSNNSSSLSTSVSSKTSDESSNKNASTVNQPNPEDTKIEKLLEGGRNFYRDKQYRACIDAMNQILAIDAFNKEARNLKNLSEQSLRVRGEL